jgi:NYN domain
MPEESRTRRLAILIDADNTSPRIAAGLFEEIAKFGEASVRRIYGDFSGQRLKSWADILQKYATDPYQQFAYTTGKNASDIALVIDSMDLYTAVDSTVSVSSLRTATSRALPLVCGNRVPMSSASASRRPPRVSVRRAVSSFTLRTCYPRLRFRLPKRGLPAKPYSRLARPFPS